jgi:Flp pilus assembly protein TadD
MNHIEHARRRAALACAGALLALALAGCGATKSLYPNAADQQERAEAGAASANAAKADSQGTYLNLVEQMQREGLWFASLAHIDALEQRWGRSPESTRLRADALRQTGQAEESRKLYAKLMGTPLEAAGYRGLGLLAGSQADYGQAVQLLEQARQRTPTDNALLSDLGYANLRAGRTAQARVPLMQAMQLRPDSPQVQANVALYLLASRQPEQADALMEAQRMSPAKREAIRQAARELPADAADVSAGPQPAGAPAGAGAAAPAAAEAAPPLALKTSTWPRRVHVMVRTAEPEAAAQVAAAAPADAPGAAPVPSSIAEVSAPSPVTGAQP